MKYNDIAHLQRPRQDLLDLIEHDDSVAAALLQMVNQPLFYGCLNLEKKMGKKKKQVMNLRAGALPAQLSRLGKAKKRKRKKACSTHVLPKVTHTHTHIHKQTVQQTRVTPTACLYICTNNNTSSRLPCA
jgi:hypothetical protein